MSAVEVLAVVAAGLAAGAINAVVGSGTLVTFPVLLAVGLAPVTANVSNTIGLVPGSLASAWGFRRELRGQRRRARRLGAMTAAGALLGSVALLVAPAAAFRAIVPAFIVVALVLVVAQPRIAAALAHRQRAGHEGRAVRAGVLATGVYGGYFGAAQGILLLGLLGSTLPEPLVRVNALKNVLAGLANAVASLVFVVAADVAWDAAACVAAGAIAGGALGAHVGRRLPPAALRGLVVVVGVTAIAQLVT
ncbi:MAG TPA: sulfite exporter TauE/SafE family protein [Baekduia sp.]|nr:sulfite exporter TauE/SafE family protein [Baekduia sp.]